MLDFYFTAYLTLLFAVIVPGILLTLPPGGSKVVVALTHGLVFAIVFQLVTFYLFDINTTSEGNEGFGGYGGNQRKPPFNPVRRRK
jgi:hypothetical protein